MLRGETVVVMAREKVGEDAMGMPVYEKRPVEVANVLVAPGSTTDATDDMRPEGVRAVYSLTFPKAYDGPPLDNLTVVVRGEELRIIGAPRPYDPSMCPTDWNMTAEAGAMHG